MQNKRKGGDTVKHEKLEWPSIGMTASEAAQVLRVSERELRDMLARGELDSCARIVGREWRISHDGLKLWLMQGGGRKRNNAEAED